MNKILFSKKSDNWRTPKKIYKKFMEENFFDPCPYESKINGLEISWSNKNFVNPPYSKIKEFVEKAIEEHKKGKEIILLIPARTDTKYFEKLVKYGSEITFITGRMHFNNSNSAPFPSCYIKLNGKKTVCKWKKREEEE